MTLTKTIYPPAGATALLAAIDPQVQQLGWYLLPLVLLSATLTLVTSLLLNNIQRRYPTYWWTPVDLTKNKEERRGGIEKIISPSGSCTPERSPRHGNDPPPNTIVITSERILVPDGILLTFEENGIFEILRNRLGQRYTKLPVSGANA